LATIPKAFTVRFELPPESFGPDLFALRKGAGSDRQNQERNPHRPTQSTRH